VQVTSVVAQAWSKRRLGAGSRQLLQSSQDTVRVTFTIVTNADPTSATSTEAIAAKLQSSVNDGTVIKSVNAQTGLDFEAATMGYTSSLAKAEEQPDYLAWAIAVTCVMAVLIVVVLVLAIMMVSGPKQGAGTTATVEMRDATSNAKIGAQQGTNTNPLFHGGEAKDTAPPKVR
jgi:hypothetical protein